MSSPVYICDISAPNCKQIVEWSPLYIIYVYSCDSCDSYALWLALQLELSNKNLKPNLEVIIVT